MRIGIHVALKPPRFSSLQTPVFHEMYLKDLYTMQSALRVSKAFEDAFAYPRRPL